MRRNLRSAADIESPPLKALLFRRGAVRRAALDKLTHRGRSWQVLADGDRVLAVCDMRLAVAARRNSVRTPKTSHQAVISPLPYSLFPIFPIPDAVFHDSMKWRVDLPRKRAAVQEEDHVLPCPDSPISYPLFALWKTKNRPHASTSMRSTGVAGCYGPRSIIFALLIRLFHNFYVHPSRKFSCRFPAT